MEVIRSRPRRCRTARVRAQFARLYLLRTFSDARSEEAVQYVPISSLKALFRVGDPLAVFPHSELERALCGVSAHVDRILASPLAACRLRVTPPGDERPLRQGSLQLVDTSYDYTIAEPRESFRPDGLTGPLVRLCLHSITHDRHSLCTFACTTQAKHLRHEHHRSRVLAYNQMNDITAAWQHATVCSVPFVGCACMLDGCSQIACTHGPQLTLYRPGNCHATDSTRIDMAESKHTRSVEVLTHVKRLQV